MHRKQTKKFYRPRIYSCKIMKRGSKFQQCRQKSCNTNNLFVHFSCFKKSPENNWNDGCITLMSENSHKRNKIIVKSLHELSRDMPCSFIWHINVGLFTVDDTFFILWRCVGVFSIFHFHIWSETPRSIEMENNKISELGAWNLSRCFNIF